MDKFEIYVHGKLYIENYSEFGAMCNFFTLRQRYGDENVEIRIVQSDNKQRW